MSKVKICGITNNEDALWAANLGADVIGLNFCSASPRKVSVKQAMKIVDGVPGFISIVGVFVDESILPAIDQRNSDVVDCAGGDLLGQ